MRDYFHQLADALTGGLQGGELLLMNLAAEDSVFARLNRNRLRHGGRVRRSRLELDLIDGERHATAGLDLSGERGQDLELLRAMLDELRAQRAWLPADPHLLHEAEGPDSEQLRDSSLPEPAEALAQVTDNAQGLDLVGIWASGEVFRGFASSLGRRHWSASGSFNLDWSCYHAGDKAVKATYAGAHWEPAALSERMESVRDELAAFDRPARTLNAGSYRAYLAPAALGELLDIVAWGGFGLKSHRTGQSPLLGLSQGGRRLSPSITLVEEHAGGLAPGFTAEGHLLPQRVPLITAGEFDQCLADARSAKEYGVAVNAASEYPGSLDLAPGELPTAEVLAALDTGVYISNLWYLNYSDRNAGRITGMTRFACLWVEGGRIQGPIDVMRFDDSLYRLLGEALEALTVERELMLDAGSYGGRSDASARLPGLLVSSLRFTL